MDYKKTIQNAGLTAKEASLFIVLLELTRGTISNIARKAKMPRTSVYPLIQSLFEKGFIHDVKVSNHTEWEAIEPKRLFERNKENLKNLKSILPQLEGLRGKKEEHRQFSEILFYQSREGIKRAYEETLRLPRGERVYSIEGSISIEAKLGYFKNSYIRDWQAQMKTKGVIWESITGERTLLVIKEIEREVLEYHLGRMVILSVVPESLMDFSADIITFRSTLIIVVVERDLAIFIRNPEVANAFRHLFKIAETAGKKVDLNTLIRTEIQKKSH